MSSETTTITIIGNLVSDPELRWTQSGVAVAGFTVASTPRTFDRQAGEWRDGEALFLRCSAWRDLATNAAETLTKGMRVIAQGRLSQRSYETREGEKRTSIELEVDEIGPSLRFATAKVTRTQRGPGGGGGFGGPPPSQRVPDGGWGQPAGTSEASAQSGWGNDGEPPF